VNAVIFGAGEVGSTTLQTLHKDMGTYYRIVSCLDDDPDKQSLGINGVPIQKPGPGLSEILTSLQVELLILAVQQLPVSRRKQLVEACLQAGVQILVVPPVYKWINGELSFKQIREVRIEDVLGR